jgi:hypothetical protein
MIFKILKTGDSRQRQEENGKQKNWIIIPWITELNKNNIGTDLAVSNHYENLLDAKLTFIILFIKKSCHLISKTGVKTFSNSKI